MQGARPFVGNKGTRTQGFNARQAHLGNKDVVTEALPGVNIHENMNTNTIHTIYIVLRAPCGE